MTFKTSSNHWNLRQFHHLILILLLGATAGLPGLQVYRQSLRRNAVHELRELLAKQGSGKLLIETRGCSSIARYLGLDEEWYFTDCVLQLRPSPDLGVFLIPMSNRAASIITELQAVDAIYLDKALLQINRMHSLRLLTFTASQFSDHVFSSLDPKSLPHLREIEISENRLAITDDGILKSAIIPQLKVLDIGFCENITDKSIPAFVKCKHLQFLRLNVGGITQGGKRALERQLGEHVEIEFSD